VIAHVDRDYRETIVARSKRDYVWIMARQPQLSDADYARLQKKVLDLGYDVAKLQKVPQRW
jgi:apolipoprotein D and lipocalin family protein